MARKNPELELAPAKNPELEFPLFEFQTVIFRLASFLLFQNKNREQ